MVAASRTPKRMPNRHSGAPGRSASAPHRATPVHRGPQASSLHASTLHHPANAALLIDFDNVTMGIRSDLDKELRSLLSSDIIKGKVAVQRAYADWRRYQQYVMPLTAASIDLVWAVAYGPSKKNATDIRLAIDALELVFTRPEIGTFILLSGDSDFTSLVIKLKEYGKYVIGVGIRESSSDLLVQNCDEYYSYNALAGLVNTREEEPPAKWDPFQLVTESVQRMKRNGDVMRADRLKQVMQEIDPSFDEKDLGMSKFSRFVQEAAHRGVIVLRKLENGQLEVDAVSGAAASAPLAPPARERGRADAAGREEAEERPGRRRGRGRGRDRDRGAEVERAPRIEGPAAAVDREAEAVPAHEERPRRGDRGARDGRGRSGREARTGRPDRVAHPPRGDGGPAHAGERTPREEIGASGERLTRDEAFSLVRRAVASGNGRPMSAADLRARARELLGRDSTSLAQHLFERILRDAHDAEVIDLRRRGDDLEVGLPMESAARSERLERQEERATAAATLAAALPAPPRGGGVRGRVTRSGKASGIPPELLLLGAVDHGPDVVPHAGSASGPTIEETPEIAEGPRPRARARARSGRKAAAADTAAAVDADKAKKPRRPRGRKTSAAEA